MTTKVLRSRCSILVAILLCAIPSTLFAQEEQEEQIAKRKTDFVYLLHADETRFDKRINADAQILVGNVAFRHDSLYMYCDSALFYEASNSLEAYGSIHMNQGDTLFLDGEQLFYDGNTMLAKIRYNVCMKDPAMTLTTDSLNYDRTMSLGYYFDWGTLKDTLNTLTSIEGEYDTQTKDATFNYEVTLTNDNFVLTTDTLGYNTGTRIATITGPSDIDSKENHIYSTLGYYYTAQEQCWLFERSVFTNADNKLTGDSLYYDRNLHFGEGFHNVVLDDFKNNCRLNGDYIFYDELNDSAYATGRALATDYSRGDSLFIHGDTLRMTTHTMVKVSDKKDAVTKGNGVKIPGMPDIPSIPTALSAGNDSTALGTIALPLGNDSTALDVTTLSDEKDSTAIQNILPDSLDSGTIDATLQATVDSLQNLTPDSLNGLFSPILTDTTTLALEQKDDSLQALSTGIKVPELMDAYPPIIPDSLATDSVSEANTVLDSITTYRIIEAFRKVRIYRSDMQAVCDSLIFNSLDSCLTMYYDPIIWNGNQQILGEKIMIYLNDSTIEWAHIENQALMVEQLDTAHYNQISGRDIKAYFINGNIEHSDVEGNVEVIYYYREEGDSIFVGMNTTEASLLTAYLVDKQVEKLLITGKSNGVFYPMDQIPPEERKLSSFAWFAHIRPLSQYDLFYWRGKTSEQKLKKTNRSAVPLPTLEGLTQ